MKNKKSQIGEILLYFYLVFSFAILDVWLRVMTRWINRYSIYALVPNLFTCAWSMLLAAVVMLLALSYKTAGRTVYIAAYIVFLLLAIVEYGAYLVLGKFLFISDFMYASEGLDYISYVMEFVTADLVLQIVGLIFVGAIGYLALGYTVCASMKKKLSFVGIIVLCVLCICLFPELYGKKSEEEKWDDFANPAREYEWFINSNYDMQLTGLYQYFVRDGYLQYKRSFRSADPNGLAEIEEFFAEREEHNDNDMTGIFRGKNLIVVMLESVDDWLINKEHTPVLSYMKENGIDLTNMYTPAYSSGYTFNTEFAYNTSIYPYTNGNVAYSLVRNRLNHGIPGMFLRQGYRVESFHEGVEGFYNRGEMHAVFGYEKYHSYYEYSQERIPVWDDEFLTESEELYRDLIEDRPFYSYVITFGGHLPYKGEDPTIDHALKKYPQYDTNENRELSVVRAKVKSTDDMFRRLLTRLYEDQLLEDTVIVAFADHYAYGFSDYEYMKQETEKNGNSIMERTPAFIYCSDWKQPMKVEKVMQTTDLAPTIMNLFGLEVPKDIMGQDVFDESYPGFAIFPGNTWLTNEAYMKNGLLQWNNGMTSEEISLMNKYVQRVYRVNDLILDTDYYRNKNQ